MNKKKLIFKIVFIGIPCLLVAVLLSGLLFIYFFTTPQRVETLAVNTFSSISSGTLSMNVVSFSPCSGFVIENIIIRNGPEFNESVLLSIDRFVLDYSFFAVLTGSIRIPEIGIYNPSLYIEQKGDKWSPAVLMKTGPAEEKDDKVEDEIDDKEKDKPDDPSDSISLPLAVDVFVNFILENLNVEVKGEEFNASAEGLNLKAGVDIPPFKEVPLSLQAVSILRYMDFHLNPANKISFEYSSEEAELSSPLMLSLSLLFDRDGEPGAVFESSLDFGVHQAPVRFQQTHLAPLSFKISYDLYYDPMKDLVTLNYFEVTFQKSKWISLAGTVKEASASPAIDLRMNESFIALDELYPYYVNFTGDRATRFGGSLSLYPLTIRGGSDVDLKGALNGKGVYFSSPDFGISMPGLNLEYEVEKNDEEIILGKKFNLPGFRYTLEGERSGANSISASADLSSSHDFSEIKINRFSLRFFSPSSGRDALLADMSGALSVSPRISGNINLTRLRLAMPPLLETLPPSIKDDLGEIPLEKPVDLNAAINFNIGDPVIGAGLSMLFRIPDYDVEDLRLNLALKQNNSTGRLAIRNFDLSSKKFNSGIKGRGFVDLNDNPFSDADINFTANVDASRAPNVLGPWDVSGLLEMQAAFKGNLENGVASGSILIDDFNMKNEDMMFDLAGLNVYFPFSYNLAEKDSPASILKVGKEDVIDNAYFRESPNFRMKSLDAAHPARDESFRYIADLEAFLEFENNIFRITGLRTYFLEGSIHGNKIAFNPADLNPSNMEFVFELDVTNVNVARLDSPDAAPRRSDAVFSMNSNLSGKGLDIGREISWKGYINIHKIGERFASHLLQGLGPKKGESSQDDITKTVLDNSMYVEGFDFRLDRGLIYSNVILKRGVLGYLVGIEDNKIEFERMPIQEYLRNIMREE